LQGFRPAVSPGPGVVHDRRVSLSFPSRHCARLPSRHCARLPSRDRRVRAFSLTPLYLGCPPFLHTAPQGARSFGVGPVFTACSRRVFDVVDDARHDVRVGCERGEQCLVEDVAR
jgi:hypothetical protein